jgi:hypothetical protein
MLWISIYNDWCLIKTYKEEAMSATHRRSVYKRSDGNWANKRDEADRTAGIQAKKGTDLYLSDAIKWTGAIEG